MEDTTVNEVTTSNSENVVESDTASIDGSSANETTGVASDTKEDSNESIIQNTTVEETTVKQEENIMAASTGQVQEEPYDIQDLIDNCKALGYKKEVVAGALFGSTKTEMTKTEFETTIKNFLGKKVS